jgi:hypothetical protein
LTRARLVTALVVVAAVLLVATALTAYAWRALYDSDQFANRATAALQDRDVRTAIADRITDELVVPARPELLAARPVIASVVSGMVGGDAFASVFRRGVRDVHAALFRSDRDTLTLTLVDVAIVAAAAVRELDPGLAAQIDADERIALAGRDIGAATADAVRLARRLRVLAFVLGGLTLAAMAAALALSADRRGAVSRLGVAIVGAGVAVVALETIARAAVVRDPAAGGVWDAYLGDLRTSGWVLAIAGAVVAAAAASLIRPIAVEEPLRSAWRIVGTEPGSTALRVVRGLALVAVGVLVIAAPLSVLRIAVTLAGVYVLYKGVEALLRLTYDPGAAETPRPRPRRVAVPAVATLLVAGAFAAFLAGGGVAEPAPRASGCNGHAELCDRPLDEVTLPATHNSMSVPSPGWFASLQERPIAGQLEDGVRGLLFDTHYADRLANGRTRTYFGSSDDLRRAIQQDGVSEQGVESALRLRERLGFRGEGERGLYLCHTFCELGSTPLEPVLDEIHEFLVTHPADVLVIVNQDYVTPSDFVAAMADAGLARYALVPPAGSGWPTLGELVERDQRLVVLAENEAGAAPWYQLAYERLTQETPFGFSATAQLTAPADVPESCRPNRGAAAAPLFLVNHWINTDPVPRPGNADIVNARDALLGRARECRRIRRRSVNLLAVDFYERGDLFDVVDRLNGVG